MSHFDPNINNDDSDMESVAPGYIDLEQMARRKEYLSLRVFITVCNFVSTIRLAQKPTGSTYPHADHLCPAVFRCHRLQLPLLFKISMNHFVMNNHPFTNPLPSFAGNNINPVQFDAIVYLWN